MRQAERRELLMGRISQNGMCRVSDLARQLSVSQETIRRELKKLEAEGLVLKKHGVVELPDMIVEGPFETRMKENAEAKRRIGVAAAGQVENGMTVFIDGGSTSFYVAKELSKNLDIIVVTNSIPISSEFSSRGRGKIFMCGGAVDAQYRATYDRTAQDYLENFATDIAILSIGAIDLDQGLMDYHAGEAEVAKIAIKNTKNVMIVADHSKFDKRALSKVGRIDDVDILVTNTILPEKYLKKFHKSSVIFSNYTG